jgi:hypothetical protein
MREEPESGTEVLWYFGTGEAVTKHVRGWLGAASQKQQGPTRGAETARLCKVGRAMSRKNVHSKNKDWLGWNCGLLMMKFVVAMMCSSMEIHNNEYKMLSRETIMKAMGILFRKK